MRLPPVNVVGVVEMVPNVEHLGTRESVRKLGGNAVGEPADHPSVSLYTKRTSVSGPGGKHRTKFSYLDNSPTADRQASCPYVRRSTTSLITARSRARKGGDPRSSRYASSTLRQCYTDSAPSACREGPTSSASLVSDMPDVALGQISKPPCSRTWTGRHLVLSTRRTRGSSGC